MMPEAALKNQDLDIFYENNSFDWIEIDYDDGSSRRFLSIFFVNRS